MLHLRGEATDRHLQYVVEDKGVSGSTYYVCNTKCLVDLAASEREFCSDDDYLDSQE